MKGPLRLQIGLREANPATSDPSSRRQNVPPTGEILTMRSRARGSTPSAETTSALRAAPRARDPKSRAPVASSMSYVAPLVKRSTSSHSTAIVPRPSVLTVSLPCSSLLISQVMRSPLTSSTTSVF
jgi:hypothetical protein